MGLGGPGWARKAGPLPALDRGESAALPKKVAMVSHTLVAALASPTQSVYAVHGFQE